MQVKPMFKEPAEVRLSKSEISSLVKAALIVGHLEKIRPDLELANVADLLAQAVDVLKPESKQ